MDAHKAILFKVARAKGATHADREGLFEEITLQLWHSVETSPSQCRRASTRTWRPES